MIGYISIKRPNADGIRAFSFFTVHSSLFTCFAYPCGSFRLGSKRLLLRNQLRKLFFQFLFVRTVRE